MLNLDFDLPPHGTVFCFGAHCDDIEIGCSATLVELAKHAPGLNFVWTVFSGDATRESETRAAAAMLLGKRARIDVQVHRFRGSYLPESWSSIKDVFESLKQQLSPDLIFTHALHDRHQDHRIVSELTWNTFRDHSVLEYEIPKYEGDLTQPNFLVPIPASTLAEKLDMLSSCFASQRERAWFDSDVFRGLMRIRGIECNAASGFAEGFHARKLRFKPGTRIST